MVLGQGRAGEGGRRVRRPVAVVLFTDPLVFPQFGPTCSFSLFPRPVPRDVLSDIPPRSYGFSVEFSGNGA